MFVWSFGGISRDFYQKFINDKSQKKSFEQAFVTDNSSSVQYDDNLFSKMNELC